MPSIFNKEKQRETARSISEQVAESVVLALSALLGAIIITLSTVPCALADEESDQSSQIASGVFGTCTWSIDASGALVIKPASGDTGMLEAQYSEAESWPWRSYSDSITSVTVEGSVDAQATIGGMFQGLPKLESADLRGLDTSEVANMHDLFQGDASLRTVDLSGLDTSNVETMRWMFGECSSLESIDMSSWSTAKNSDWNYMFYECRNLRNLDISKMTYDANIVSRASSVFGEDAALEMVNVSDGALAGMLPVPSVDGADGKWVRSDGTYGPFSPSELSASWTSGMSGEWVWSPASFTVVFDSNGGSGSMSSERVPVAGGKALTANSFTREESSFYSWNTAPDGNGASYDDGASIPAGAYKPGDVVVLYAQWGLPRGQITDSVSYQWDASTKTLTVYPTDGVSGNLGDNRIAPFKDENERRISSLVENLVVTGSIKIGSSLMSVEIGDFHNLKTADLRGLDVSSVNDMRFALSGLTKLEKLNVSGWDTSHVTSMSSLLLEDKSLKNIDLSSWDTSNVTSMDILFRQCDNLRSVNIHGWNTSNVTNMNGMFANCPLLASIEADELDISKTSDISLMFLDCKSLEKLDGILVNKSNTKTLTVYYGFLYGCSSLESADLSGIVFAGESNPSNNRIFNDDISLQKIMLPASAGSIAHMLSDATSSDDNSRWVKADKTYGPLKPSEMTASWTDAMAGEWERAPHYSIRYHYNFGDDRTYLLTKYDTGTSYPIDSSATRTGYELAGWNTMPDGTGTAYSTSENIEDITSPGETIDLYAQWSFNGLAHGTYGGVDWVIANDGAMALSPHSGSEGSFPDSTHHNAYGDIDASRETSEWPWDEYRAQIISFKVEGGTVHAGNSTMAMLQGCKNLKVFEPSNFDVSNVANMNNMFNGCESLTSLDLSTWNTSKLFDMIGTFACCYNLKHLDLSSWDTSYVQSFNSCFSEDRSLEDLYFGDNWKTGHATSFTWMFANCKKLNLSSMYSLNNWDTSHITDAHTMFYGCENTKSINISNWDVSHISDMSDMFTNCTALTNLDVSKWNTTNLTDAHDMFGGCANLNSLDISKWSTTRLANANGMFSHCNSLTDLDVSQWNTENLQNASSMFSSCSNLSKLDVSKWNTRNISNMMDMFSSCTKLEKLDLSGWNTGNVEDMNRMFYGDSALTEITGIGNLNTESATSMSSMFKECSSLEALDLSKWSTVKLLSIDSMFDDCTRLKNLDISGWDLTSNTSTKLSMFNNDENLERIVLPEKSEDKVANVIQGLPEAKTHDKEWVREDGAYSPYTVSDLSTNWNTDMAGAWVWHRTVQVTVPVKASWTGMNIGPADESATWNVSIASDVNGTIDVDAESSMLKLAGNGISVSDPAPISFASNGVSDNVTTATIAVHGEAKSVGAYTGNISYFVDVKEQ